jgi:8-oxo-dGTP pyrophosphatase MutT (NUDIX family)
MMDVLPLLDELQTIARNGLYYARDPFDRERYERLYDLVTSYYGQALDMPPAGVRERLALGLGYITPQVGADAAIFDERGRILLELRKDTAAWCLPCGWVDPNEAPVETAVREAHEEVGLEIRPLKLVDVFATAAGGENGPHTVVAIVYLCEITGGTLEISHEIHDAQYWDIDDVPVWHARHRDYALAAREVWRAAARGQ